jgi:hypothetical protein
MGLIILAADDQFHWVFPDTQSLRLAAFNHSTTSDSIAGQAPRPNGSAAPRRDWTAAARRLYCGPTLPLFFPVSLPRARRRFFSFRGG